jgi:hypothetical protein
MSVFFRQSKTANGNSNLGFWLAGIALVVAFIVLVWMQMPAPPEPMRVTPPNPFADPKAGEAHIRKLAQLHGTNWDALTNDEKIFLNSIAYGHGRELLAKYAREVKEKPSGSGATLAPQTP